MESQKGGLMSFQLGRTVMTNTISRAIEENPQFATEVRRAATRYLAGDWGDLCDADKESNDLSVRNGDDLILGKYTTCEGDIYIITEWDRSVTTVLFPDEY